MTKQNDARKAGNPDNRTIRAFLLLHGAVFLYSLVTVCAGTASVQEMLSLPFFGWLLAEAVLLFVYALIWQQVMKRIELSVGYANKAAGLLWALLWSVLLFHDRVTPGKIFGIALVIGGILLMNTERKRTDTGGRDG